MAHGYAGVAMREIAERLDVSKAALYHHFHDKEALLLEVLMTGVQRAGTMVAEATASPGDTRARVHALLSAMARDRHQQFDAMKLAEREAANLSEAARATMLRAYRTEFLGPIEHVLRQGQEAGEVRPDLEPAWLTRVLLTLAQPLLSVDAAALERTAAATTALFFEGAGAHPQGTNARTETGVPDPS
ncbi:MAG: TetR/AcrR family transcriptional regulator [Trueperaceae bacterium]|nr:TetR/AcrR family transcriptional regulator [Trueperaceae bacterium]MCO5174282.1 TetR/AcrR family transcriptional regulator [Trueperaceae bacterium]MCW5819776.1 TetR/AcrR family transcriptional regulator [Trueperaceae bacterium]